MTCELQLDTCSGQFGLFDEKEEYEAFTEKFKHKLTTDDCYTPDNIYEAVAEWVGSEYSVDRESFVRPFWPGGDYKAVDYNGRICVDNPPFSIRAEIIDWYQAHGVRFFLFSPALTLLSRRTGVCHIATGVNITYANGAEVPTSFVTNLETECALRTAPELYRLVKEANEVNERARKKQRPKYIYPDYVITAAIAQRWCHYGIDYRLPWTDCVGIGALDAQKAVGKTIFGYGYLLSERAAAERAAAERAAAERAAAERWTLSEREMAIVAQLGK